MEASPGAQPGARPKLSTAPGVRLSKNRTILDDSAEKMKHPSSPQPSTTSSPPQTRPAVESLSSSSNPSPQIATVSNDTALPPRIDQNRIETFPRFDGPCQRATKKNVLRPAWLTIADAQVFVYKAKKDNFPKQYLILSDLVRDPNETCVPQSLECHLLLPADKVKLKFDTKEQMDAVVGVLVASYRTTKTLSAKGRVTLPVWFPDGTKTLCEVEIGKTTVEELWWLVCEAIVLPLTSREYFFIWGVGKELELLLRADDIVTTVQDTWFDTEKKYFDRVQAPVRFLFHSVPGLPLFEEVTWKDPKLIFILYHQAVYHLRNGNYILSFDEFMETVGYRLQADLGNFDPAKHRPGYIQHTLERWVPKYLKKVKKRSRAQWEDLLTAAHRKRTNMSTIAAQSEYLERIRALPIYGGIMFKVVNQVKEQGSAFWNTKGESDKVGLVLSVNMDGLHLMDPYDKTLQRHFSFQDIISFQISQERFLWLELSDPNLDRNLEFLFRTPLASLISDMIKEFAYEVHAFRYHSRLLR